MKADRENLLIITIKKKWFDMILSGEKKEEYREIKPYYMSRIRKIWYVPTDFTDHVVIEGLKNYKEEEAPYYEVRVLFRNGYKKDSPSFIAKCTLSIGSGREEWGAEKGKEYFVFLINEIKL